MAKFSNRRAPGYSSATVRKPLIEVRGKLGKVQKSRKHKGVRAVSASSTDFYEKPVQERAPIRQIAAGIDAVPRCLDQETPYKVKMIKKFKEEGLSKRQHKRRCQAQFTAHDGTIVSAMEHGMTRSLKPVPEFKKGTHECKKAFLYRVEEESLAAITKSKLERKFKVDFDDTDGVLKIKKKTKRREKQIKFRKEKKQQDNAKKKEKTQDKGDGFGKLTDRVAFGEVAHAPPELHAKPRQAKAVSSKVSKLSSLRLMSVLHGDKQAPGASAGRTFKATPLAPSQQMRLEAERDRVIALYRQMKARKLLERQGTAT